MSKIFLSFVISIMSISFVCETSFAVVDSRSVFSGNRELLGEQLDIKDYSNISIDGRSCQNREIRCIIESIIEYLKKLLLPIAIVLLMWSGIYLLLVRTDEEAFKKRKNEVFGIFAGFMIILISASLIDNVFFGTQGEILQGADTSWFAQSALIQINGLVNFLLTFVVPVGVLVLIVSAFQLIIGGGDDEQMSKAKKKIIYVIIGIAVILLTQSIVGALTGGEEIKPINAKPYLIILVSWINWILGFIGVLGVLAIVWAGISMIAHFGDEERVESAKNIIKFVAIGLIIAFSSWTIIRFFLTAGN